ncbi:MAG TPA: hypothetical protein VIK01_16085 [Polyangiaceae bacterium]
MSSKNRVKRKARSPAATATSTRTQSGNSGHPGGRIQAPANAPEKVVAVSVVDSPDTSVVVEDPDREGTIDIYKQALESFDRTMVTVSGGALAVSITFLHDVAPSPTPWSLLPLIVGWGGLIASLGAIIISMPVGHRSIELRLAGEDDSKMTKYTTWLNSTSVVALLVGFMGLAVFAGMNMFVAKPKAPAAQPTLVQCVEAPKRVTTPAATVEPPPAAPAAPAPKTPAPARSAH